MQLSQFPMLVVDKNIVISQREQAAWQQVGISTVRVDTMQEAIKKLTTDAFLFVAINGDNVNYMPLLKVMSETSGILIYVIESVYAVDRKIAALKNGAHAYATFDNDAAKNVQLALALIQRHNEIGKAPRLPEGMLIYDMFLVVSSVRRIYCNDERVTLTRKEYEILQYLIENHDITLTYKQIYNKVWRREYDEISHQPFWDYMRRIRTKIKVITGEREFIFNERDVGYQFSARYDR